MSAFTTDFYEKMLRFMCPHIRSFNHNLAVKLSEKQELCRDEAGEIEALKCLFKYHELVKLSSEKFEDYEYFQERSAIKVHVDFKKVNNKIETFEDLREKLKTI